MNGSQICIWFPFHLLATVVANSRQATVIMAEKRDRSLEFPSAARRIEQLALSAVRRQFPVLNCLQLSPRIQVHYGFRLNLWLCL